MVDTSFTFSSYTQSIEGYLDSDYQVGSFIKLIDSSTPKQLILRHDVDNSLEQAMRIAELEASLNVTATYFLRVLARGYNLMDLPNLLAISRLRELGHEVGLHVEVALNDVLGGSLLEFLDRQKAVFDAAVDSKCVGVSLHEPARMGGYDFCNQLLDRWDLKYHAYQDRYFNKEYKYLSDSSGRWREGHFGEWIDKTPKLQVLTHPIWWFERIPQEVY